MDWLLANWFWILIFVLFIAMHLFGHGGHGGGHHHGGRSPKERDEDETQDRAANTGASGHHH